MSSLYELRRSNTVLIYCFFSTVSLNHGVIVKIIHQCFTNSRQAVQYSLSLLLPKYDNSQPYILVQYDANSFTSRWSTQLKYTTTKF